MTSTEEENDQQKWFRLCKELGKEKARALVAERLRYAAAAIEKGGFPDIFGANVPHGKPFGDTFIETFSVTLSYPWPG